MSIVSADTVKLLKIAKEYQQMYYERLPDWHEYGLSEQKYMKQNIGFALYGLSVSREDGLGPLTCTSFNSGSDVFDEIKYDAKSSKTIDSVYEKVIEYGTMGKSYPVHLGIVYNVTFRTKTSKASTAKNDDEKTSEVCAVPIFKIGRHGDTSIVWYVDSNARVYRSWPEYKTDNVLPKCTMVVPRDGFYQADPVSPITEESSTVWLEVVNSPACATSRKVLTALDVASTVLGAGTVIGAAAAALTPAGPAVALAGFVGSSISGLWTIGRCSQTLVDLHSHAESIVPTAKKALPAWLGISGSAIGIGVNGGSILLARAARSGRFVGGIPRIAFNSLKIGNLTVNGVGMVCKGYSLVEKYRETKQIEMIDLLIFASHVLFFGNGVLNIKLAGELIRTSRENPVDKFTSDLRSQRLTAEYSRTNGSNVGEVVGIVRQVRKINFRMDFLNAACKAVWLSSKNAISFANGKIAFNNVVLMDPVQFVGLLVSSRITADYVNDMVATLLFRETDGLLDSLRRSLADWLRDYAAKNCDHAEIKLLTVNDFDNVLNELKCVSNGDVVLPKILKIAMTLLQHYNDPADLLAVAVRFVWEYSKMNLKPYNVSKCNGLKVHEILLKVVSTIFNILDSLMEPMYRAFSVYRSRTRRKIPIQC